jgi:ketosteroid isomerase-like protein
LIAALNRHDLDIAEQCFGPEAVYMSSGGMAEGREQIRSYYEHVLLAYPDFCLTPLSKVSSGDVTVTEWRLTATHKGPLLAPDGGTLRRSDRRVVIRGCTACMVEDGVIVSCRVYFNELEQYAQLGLLLRSEGAS